ncbi:MAG: thiol-disulfide isomerase, partial [Bryobacteraceae bacterium]
MILSPLPALWLVSLAAEAPTFHKDVAPILQSRCQSCHRPGEIGPMPLLTYRETRPWAKSIKEAVLSRKMPPWFANAAHGRFSNDRSLTGAEIQTLAAWVDAGAPEGAPQDGPPPRRFVSGWNLPHTPDVVLEMPKEFTIPVSGRVEYTYIVLPLNLTEDKWVQMAEARPGSGKVVHHITAYIRDPESKWLRGEAQPGVPFTAPKQFPDGRPRSDLGGMGNEILFFYVPGYDPTVFAPGQAKRIRAGSDLVMEMHYTPNGTQQTDRSRVGIVFAKEPVKE